LSIHRMMAGSMIWDCYGVWCRT